MKNISVPYIDKLATRTFNDLRAALDAGGARLAVDVAPWHDQFPEKPAVDVRLAADDTHLAVLFSVEGRNLRAMAATAADPVWEDSTCEVFIAAPDGKHYYNIETNCIGTSLATRRTGRGGDIEPLSSEQLNRIVRHSTLPHHTFAEKEGNYSWQLAVIVPFDVVGYTERPGELRANFYKCADATAYPHFLCWNPIDAPTPEFHRPDCFGMLNLSEC